MKDEKKETAQALNLNGPRKHGKDGAGTRDTNPLYCGPYTIEDYERDRGRTGAMTPETVEFERFILSGLKASDPQEWERYRKIYEEAQGEFEGLTESRYGYHMDRMRVHALHIAKDELTWIYFRQYYELTDADLKAEILEGLETLEGLISFADGLHDPIKEALEGSDWLRILEEKERMKAIGTPGYVPKVPTSEEFIQKLIEDHAAPYLEGWISDATEGEESGETEAQPETFDALEETAIKAAANAILGFELRTLRKMLENDKEVLTARGETNKRLEELEAQGYGPLIQFVKENYTEDRAKRFRTPDIGIYTLYVLTEYIALAGSPPETVTADTETLLEQAYQRIEGNAERIVTVILEGQREDPEGWTPDGGYTEIKQILQDVVLSKNPDILPVPANAYMFRLGECLKGHQTTVDEFVKQIANEINIEIRAKKNGDDNEWIKSNLIIPPNLEKPTFGEIMFIEQIGAEWEKAKENGEDLTYTENQLIRIRYGTPPKKGISAKTRADFRTRLRELSNIRVLIPEKPRGIRIAPDKGKEGEEIGTIIGKEERLIDPEIRLVWNDDKQEKTTTIYTIKEKPPTRYINKWFGENAEINRDLLLTEPIPADKLSPKARTFYDRDKLRKDKRSKDQLALEDFTYADLKACILYTLTYAFHFRQKGSTTITLNLEDVYRLAYPAEKVPSMSNSAWKAYTKLVYTYLTFLIEKGCIEGYDKGQDRGKNSRVVFVYLQEGNTMLYPPKQETTEEPKKKRTGAKSKK